MSPLIQDSVVMVREEMLPPMKDAIDVVRLLARELAEAVKADAAEVERSAVEREQLEPTYVGRGMAVPHARIAGLPCAAVYVARCPAGIPWPDEVARVVVFTAAPEESPNVYLQLLAGVTRWRLRYPGGEKALLGDAPAELLEVLKEIFNR